MTDEETENLIARLVCEEFDDKDVSELRNLAADNPGAFTYAVEQIAFSELVSHALAAERDGDCFTETVKSALTVKDDNFIAAVKSKIRQDSEPVSINTKTRRYKKQGKRSRVRRRNVTPKRNPFVSVLSFAAALAFSTVAVLYIIKVVSSPVLTNVSVIEGEVSVDGRNVLAIGERIPADRLVRIFSKEATLEMKDGTTVKVRGGSLIKYDPGKENKFLLTNGRLFANVKKQKGKPLLFETPFSSAEIVGTEFSLSVYGDRDQLDVKEGEILFKSLRTKEALSVKTGQKSHVTRSGTIAYRRVPKLKGDLTNLFLLDENYKVIRELELEDTVSLNKYGRKLKLGVLHTEKIQVVLFVLNGNMVSETKVNEFKRSNRTGKVIDLPGRTGEFGIRLIPYDKGGQLKNANYLKLKIVN